MSVRTLEKELQLEVKPRRVNDNEIAYLGRLAIKSEFLGINDPLTHLYEYVKRGDESLDVINEDIVTDIAERLPMTPFVNYVDFVFRDKDFISLKDKVSMRAMTDNNLKIISSELSKRPELSIELERAVIESQEVDKIIDWYESAKDGSYFVFESLPIGEQKIAVSRIYQKISNGRLRGCYVSLYNPTISGFNDLRMQVGDVEVGDSELEILSRGYEFYDDRLQDITDFMSFYVGVYDNLNYEKTGNKTRFGLESKSNDINVNSIQKIKNQSKLTSIYVDTIKEFSKSNGMVTSKLLDISNKLNINNSLIMNQRLTTSDTRDFLREVILNITSTIHMAPDGLLRDIESSISSEESYIAASNFRAQSVASGENYASNNCPTYNVSEQTSENGDGEEFEMLADAYNSWELMKGFGRAKVGVCQINGCPSRGNIDHLPGKTVVGGCGVCIECHKIFLNGKNPADLYSN